MQEFNPEERQDNQKPKESFFASLNPFSYVIIVLAIVFFLYQFIGGALAIISGVDVEGNNVRIARVILAFGQYMFILAPAIFFARLQTNDLKQTFRLFVPPPHLVLLSILGIILLQPFLQGYMILQDYLLNHIPFMQDSMKYVKDIFDMLEKASLKIVSAHSPFEFGVIVFVICVTPAICEEILFRGFVLKNLQKVSKPGIAVFMSGFLFAVYHFQPFNLIPLIILGTFLGFIVYYSNSIFTGMLCHFLNNFTATFLLYKYGKEDLETPHLTNSQTNDIIIASIASFALFMLLMFLFYKWRVKVNPETGNE